MSDLTNLAYLAGVVDSDGWIGIRRTRTRWADTYQPGVAVKQVTPEAVSLAHATFGGHLWQQAPGATRGRPLWTWGVTAAAVVPVLRSLRPYLRIKAAQADNALAACEVNGRGGRRRFPVPDVIAGEPLVTAAEAAAATGLTYESVCQAARKGSVPVVREGRRILIPASFLPVWRDRGSSPRRDPAVTAELDALYERQKALNRGGV